MPESHAESSSTDPSLQFAWGCALGLAAGWIASGSCGPIATSLQSLLVWILLAATTVLVRPRIQTRSLVAAAAAVAFVLLLPRIFGSTPLLMPLAVVTVLGTVALGRRGIHQRMLVVTGLAVLAVTLLRLIQLQIPLAWMLSDLVGEQLGNLAGWLVGRPMHLGASFAGLDLLVVMTAFVAGLVGASRRPRFSTAALAVTGIVLAQSAYLMVLAHTPQLTAWLPPVAVPVYDGPYIPPEFCWSTVAHQSLPWYLPALGVLLQTVAAVFIIRWTRWSAVGEPNAQQPHQEQKLAIVVILLVTILPIVSALSTGPSTLSGKKILATEQDDIDFQIPEHDSYGQQSAGMFGLLPTFVRSLGGEMDVTNQLTERQLADTDLLLLVHPNEAIAEQNQLIFDYVRGGGSVLFVTDGFSPEFGMDHTAELLGQTAIQVSQDAATSETGEWQGAYLTSTHAATLAARAPETRFLTDYGASLRLGWGSRPLVIGQWGWSAPQQEATWDESEPLQTGDKLGDLVLAAEQRVGQGRVIVLGGNVPLSNEGLVKSYPFLGNLFAYLTHIRPGPQALWRQAISLLCCISIVVLLLRNPGALVLTLAAVLLALTLASTLAISRHAARVVPSGDLIAGDNETTRLAYIDQSHLEAFSFEDWGYDAVNGLALNLARNGFLPLTLSKITAERLDKADLLVLIAPSEQFTRTERSAVNSFVERGGVLICLAGAEQAESSNSLLSEFGLRVPPSPVGTGHGDSEPEPFGRTRPLYLNVELADEGESYQVGMRMHAAWPVESTDGQANIIAYGHNQLRVVESDTELPVIARQYGRGSVILIGDTGFAMNKNLEYIGGEPFDGDYENAHFWRWLIARLTGPSEWVPPRSTENDAAAATEESR